MISKSSPADRPRCACDEPGAICTADGRALSEGIATTVEGPDTGHLNGGALPSAMDRASGHDGVHVGEHVERHTSDPAMSTVRSAGRALAGTPVYDNKDRRAQQAWQDYLKLGKEILP